MFTEDQKRETTKFQGSKSCGNNTLRCSAKGAVVARGGMLAGSLIFSSAKFWARDGPNPLRTGGECAEPASGACGNEA